MVRSVACGPGFNPSSFQVLFSLPLVIGGWKKLKTGRREIIGFHITQIEVKVT